MDESLLPGPGTVLAEKYEILEPLGRGGMGLVFEARHLGLRQRVAIKFLRPALMQELECVGRFSREARAAARLSSPHVARIFDVDKTNRGVPYMVIEYLEGRDLAGELEERGSLPVNESVDWILQACSGIADAHAHGVIHRDLKPSNLFLAEAGATRILKVLDFGVSKVLSDDDVTTTIVPMQVGTPLYMSPEQVMAISEVDPRSDVWSLGVILYRMISGSFPFNAPSRSALQIAIATRPALDFMSARPESDPALAKAIMRALEKNPDERYADVCDFAAAIAPFGSGQVFFMPVTPIPGATSSARRLTAMSDTPGRMRTPSNPEEPTALQISGLGLSPVAMDGAETRLDPMAAEVLTTDGNWSKREALPRVPAPAPRTVARWVLPAALAAGACLVALVVLGVTHSSTGSEAGPRTPVQSSPPPLDHATAPSAGIAHSAEIAAAVRAPDSASLAASAVSTGKPPSGAQGKVEHAPKSPVSAVRSAPSPSHAEPPKAVAPPPRNPPHSDPVHL